MLIGFVLLLTSAIAEPMPISERIYPDQAACEKVKKRLIERRPSALIECFPVIRGDDLSVDTRDFRKIDLPQN